MKVKELKEQNNTLHLLKGIACILVVFIHVQFPGVFGDCVVAFSRAGVALFFVISGYFLFQEDDKKIAEKLPSKIIRILKLTGKAFLIYFIWESAVRFIGGGIDKVFLWYKDDLFTLSNILKIVFISYDPVVGHLWFLLALLEAYILFMLLLKFKIKIHWIIALVMIEIQIICMAFSNISDLGWNMSFFRNVWFYGLPFMMLGFWIRKKQQTLLKIKTSVLIAAAVSGGLLTLIEFFFCGNLQIYNGSIIMLMALFVISVKYPLASSRNCLITIGKKYSLNIYIYHWIVKEIIIKIKEYTKVDMPLLNWAEPVVVFLITLLIAFLFDKLYHLLRKQ